MDDNNEFDIYEDLDVFESDGKQQEKVKIQFISYGLYATISNT